jgi:hypothetical protein
MTILSRVTSQRTSDCQVHTKRPGLKLPERTHELLGFKGNDSWQERKGITAGKTAKVYTEVRNPSRFVNSQGPNRPLTCENTVPEVGLEPDSHP